MIGVALALALSGVPLASPEHVHEVDDHGHVERVVHRHFATHTASVDHEDASLDHPDTPVATIDQEYTVPTTPHIAGPSVETLGVLIEPPSAIHIGHIEFIERLIHGPPCAPTVDRGPPSSFLL
jgi:hypothetical protein